MELIMKPVLKMLLVPLALTFAAPGFACMTGVNHNTPINYSYSQPYNTYRYQQQGTQIPYRMNHNYRGDYRSNYYTSSNRGSSTTGNVIAGGLIGGLAGNGIGYLAGAQGNARTGLTIAGLLAGGLIGYNNSQEQQRDEYVMIVDGQRNSERFSTRTSNREKIQSRVPSKASATGTVLLD